ncbi:MAG: isocitrate/isopropylmalate dehydrogenase family protein [Nitrososphaeraceae archaeon]
MNNTSKLDSVRKNVYNVSLIPGDGIGPELIESATKVLQTINEKKTGLKFNLTHVEAGDSALAKYGKALPEQTLESIKKSDVCIKGPVGESAADVIIFLRRYFDLYANIRPAKTYPNIKSFAQKENADVDLVIVRENTEDLYLGWEFNADNDTIAALRIISKKASKRIAEAAFEISRLRNQKKKVVAVHKANVMRKGDGLFKNVCREVSKDFPDIEYSELYVDACSMNLIRNPEDFDVIVTTNLFGDILSDEAAQVVGGLGMGPASNIGKDFALFEPVHGAAFDIAGKNIANPSSILLSMKMMFEWLVNKYDDNMLNIYGKKIEDSIIELLKQNKKTIDIGGNLTTSRFTDEIINLI